MSVVNMKTNALIIIVMVVTTLMSGCGLLEKYNRLPVNVDVDSLTRTASQVMQEKARNVTLTLVGGHQLNQSSSGVARPVKTCIYLVKSPVWAAGLLGESSACLTPTQDLHIVASERRIIVPDQLQQISFTLTSDEDLWVLVDADFSESSDNCEPLKLQLNSNEDISNRAVWFDLHCVVDGLAQNYANQPPRYKARSIAPTSLLDGLSIHYPSEKN